MIRAIGDIGLDYHRRLSEEAKRNQRMAFKRMILLAVELSKPVVIHCGDAEEDLFTVLRWFLPREWKVNFHCMSEKCGIFTLALRHRRGGAGLVDLTPCEILRDLGDINRILPPLSKDTS